MTFISFIIPFYNCSTYIGDCIESISAANIEEPTSFEIIIVDDFSSPHESLSLAKTAKFFEHLDIKIIRHECNLGLSAARNSGIEKSIGDYIWFVDADDFFFPSALAKAIRNLKNLLPDALLIDSITSGDTPEKILTEYDLPKNNLTNLSSKDNSDYIRRLSFYAWRMVVKRNIWGNLKFPRGLYMEDIATMPVALIRCHTAFYHAEPVIAYRQHSQSIMKTWSEKKTQDFLHAGKHLHTELTKTGRLDDPDVLNAMIGLTYNLYWIAVNDVTKHRLEHRTQVELKLSRLYRSYFPYHEVRFLRNMRQHRGTPLGAIMLFAALRAPVIVRLVMGITQSTGYQAFKRMISRRSAKPI